VLSDYQGPRGPEQVDAWYKEQRRKGPPPAPAEPTPFMKFATFYFEKSDRFDHGEPTTNFQRYSQSASSLSNDELVQLIDKEPRLKFLDEQIIGEPQLLGLLMQMADAAERLRAIHAVISERAQETPCLYVSDMVAPDEEVKWALRVRQGER
jgi:hypothetical protein